MQSKSITKDEKLYSDFVHLLQNYIVRGENCAHMYPHVCASPRDNIL